MSLIGKVARLALCAMIAVPVPAWSQTDNSAAIKSYIMGLSYRPETVLAGGDSADNESIKPYTKTAKGAIICTSAAHKISKPLDSVILFAPTKGVIFPGALVKVNKNLVEGRPTSISLPRAPMKVTLDLPGQNDDTSMTVQDGNFSTYQTALDKTLTKWYGTGRIQPAFTGMDAKKVYSEQQVSLGLGFNAKWASASTDLTSKLEASNNRKHSVAVAMFKQVYFSAAVDNPPYPAAVFDPAVDVDDVKGTMDSNNPPGIVKNVDYGRLIFVRVETDSDESEADLKATINFAAGGGKGEASTTDHVKKLAKSSQFSAVVLGGSAQTAATKLFSPGDTSGLPELISSGATFNKDNPPVPIAYTVQFLRDNSLASMNFSTSYTEWSCQEVFAGNVRLVHNAAYIARFFVSWRATDESGALKDESWSSGNQGVAWTYTKDLPPGASNIKIKAEAMIWPLPETWYEIMTVNENYPTNCSYKVTGTTLIRGWEKTDCPQVPNTP